MVEWLGKWIKSLKDSVWPPVFELARVAVADSSEGPVVSVAWEPGPVEDDVLEADNGAEYDLLIFVVGMGSIAEGGGRWYWCCHIGKYPPGHDV